MSLIYNAHFDKNTRKLSFEDRAGNEIYSFTVPERAPAVDDITKPLTFKAKQDGSKVWMGVHGSPSGAFQMSRDGGNTWVTYMFDVITLNTGEEVSFRARADRTSDQGFRDYFQFKMEGKIEAWHNVMSLYRTNDFATYNTVVKYAFNGLFSGCQSLTKAPELPATTLAQSCYYSMFSGCQSLTKAPALPATTLADYCYSGMFSGCQSLKEVRIAATTTATNALKNWLGDVSATGDFYCNPNATIFPTGASGIPANWRRLNIDEETPSVDDPNKPLMLRAIADNSFVSLAKNGTLSNTYQTSTDGTNWTDYTFGTEISLNKGESVYFRCSNHPTTQSGSNFVRFSMRGKIEAWHNAYSMISSSFTDTSASVGSYGMYILFYCCVALTKAPLLLNALAEHCYDGLFYYCTSLKQAPALPATTLAEGCYEDMFDNCSALTQAPSLPATTLADGCYKGMFAGCSKLKEVRVSATTTAKDALKDWLKAVSATGDFYCDPNATIFPTGMSGIPENWVRHNIADYPN